ncbi:hypothetical protein Tco_1173128 [Tanacetum coccineum]
MLLIEMKNILNDSKDIQATMLKRIAILENDFKRAKAQSINLELKKQHQKEKNACDVSWKSKMAMLNDENVSSMTRVQHQQEVIELIENVNQKPYAYGDVRAKNKDLLMTISKLKANLKTTEKEKNVNTKFDKSTTLEKPVCVTPMKKNRDLKAKMVSKVEVKTSHFMSSSVSRPESKNTKLKNKVWLNTKSKSYSEDIKKSQSRVNLVLNTRDTMNSNVSKSNANVLKAKTINAVKDDSNLVCVSCGKDVFMISHDKCVAHYALSLNSRVQRALFTSVRS